MSSIEGRVALVTGGSRGIGRAVAIALAAAGADVALTYRERGGAADAVVEEIRLAGRRAITIQTDVADALEIERAAQSTEDALGPVSILVNNAGIAQPKALEDLTEADWDATLNVNLKSCFLLTQRVLPAMREARWGRIINLSSVAAQLGGVVGPHYAASKAGLHGLTHYYARVLAAQGITVNSIAPALIETEMVANNSNARASNIPLGRFGLPEEVASAVVLLATNAFITGQTINVNGGWYMS